MEKDTRNNRMMEKLKLWNYVNEQLRNRVKTEMEWFEMNTSFSQRIKLNCNEIFISLDLFKKLNILFML
jgi:hypothetical protein